MKLPELKRRFKNKYMIRIAAGVLVVTMAATGVSAYSVQAAKSEKTETGTEAVVEEELEDAISSITLNEKEIGKEETVYIIADSAGKEKEMIVSDHLINHDGKKTIEDVSSLKDIKNVKGDEAFTQNGNKLTWQADGNDIYYQGTSTEKAPVTQKITYYLDGKEIAPKDLAGKSGKVTMRFDYTNNEKAGDVYVPFMAVSGMLLDASFQNIEVTNGRVSADGRNNLVIGYAFPGLKESLDVEEKDFDSQIHIPEYFEVTADVENFELGMTMTAVVNATNFISVEGEDDTSVVDNLLDSLTDATGQLQDGSAALAEGVDTLQSSLGEFSNGVNTLKDGIKSYTDGAGKLSDGIGTLKTGVNTLADNVPALTNGVKQLKDGSASAVNGAAALKNGTESLKSGAEQLLAGAKDLADKSLQVSDGAAQLSGGMNDLAAGASGLKAGVDAAVAMLSGMGTELDTQKSAAQSQILAAAGQDSMDNATVALQTLQQTQSVLVSALAAAADGDNTMLTNMQMDAATASAKLQEVNAGIAGLEQVIGTVGGIGMGIDGVKAKLTSPELTGKLGELQQGAGSLNDGAKTLAEKTTELSGYVKALSDGAGQISTGTAGVADGANQVAAGSAALSDGLNTLDAGLGQLNEKTGTLGSGAVQLSDGVKQLSDGASKLVNNSVALNDGAAALKDGTGAITDGVGQLSDGAHELSDGIVTFNEEGIEKILNSYNGDLKPLMEKLQAVLDAGTAYQTYTDIAEGVNGSVKFIYKTDAIEAEN